MYKLGLQNDQLKNIMNADKNNVAAILSHSCQYGVWP